MLGGYCPALHPIQEEVGSSFSIATGSAAPLLPGGLLCGRPGALAWLPEPCVQSGSGMVLQLKQWSGGPALRWAALENASGFFSPQLLWFILGWPLWRSCWTGLSSSL